MEDITKNLRKIRELKGLSQETVADLMQKTQSSYARIERGTTKIDYADLVSFAKAIGMSVIDVITYPEVYISQKTADAELKTIIQLELPKDKKEQVLSLVFGKDFTTVLQQK